MSAFINVHCQINKHEFHLRGQYYLEAPFNVPEVWSENSICMFIATQGEWACDAQSTCSEPGLAPPASEGESCLPLTWVSSAGGFLCFQWARLALIQNDASLRLLFPCPRWNRPRRFVRAKSERCTVALSQGSEKLCNEWHFQSGTRWLSSKVNHE